MYDAQTQMVTAVMDKVIAQSEACERGILAVRNDGMAGICIVGPNCLVYAELLHPDLPPFDLYLN